MSFVIAAPEVIAAAATDLASLESSISAANAAAAANTTALMAAGAELGILVKGGEVLEASKKIDTVVFDKTGTLTVGQLAVSTVTMAGSGTSERDREEVLGLAAAVESASEHAMAAAIVAASPDPGPVNGFVAVAGCGVSGEVGGHHVEVGKPSWITRTTPCHDAALVSARLDGESRGETVVFVSVDGVVRAALTIADTLDRKSVV